MNTATQIFFVVPPLQAVSNIILASMFDASRLARLDPVLLPFVKTQSDSEQAELDQLLSLYVMPLVKRIIGHNFSSLSSKRKQDEEDLCSDVIERTLMRLRNLKEDPEAESIENLQDYIAMIVHNTWNSYLRCQFPERLRLKNRIRYALTNVKGLALWKVSGSRWCCGMRSWQNVVLTPNRISMEDLKENSSLLQFLKKLRDPIYAELPDFLERIFQCAGQPLELEELVTLVFAISGSVERKNESEIGGTGIPIFHVIADRKTSALIKLESQNYLKLIWQEIQQLPKPQRIALLLYLRDEQGNDVVSLFHTARIATIAQIAIEIGMTAVALAEIWNDLPMEDLRIAEYLRITRQQVINLRKSARKRLARRIKVIQMAK
jgi:hypothetical protein